MGCMQGIERETGHRLCFYNAHSGLGAKCCDRMCCANEFTTAGRLAGTDDEPREVAAARQWKTWWGWH